MDGRVAAFPGRLVLGVGQGGPPDGVLAPDARSVQGEGYELTPNALLTLPGRAAPGPARPRGRGRLSIALIGIEGGI
ncbi:hypothetical protein GCM10009678_11100 [Actinomadura kijaniata]